MPTHDRPGMKGVAGGDCRRMDDMTGGGMAMYAVEADRWECEAWPRYIVAEPLLKLLSVLLLSGNVGPRKCHFREIGRGPPRRRKYISRPLMASWSSPLSLPPPFVRRSSQA